MSVMKKAYPGDVSEEEDLPWRCRQVMKKTYPGLVSEDRDLP